jgi:hypothetical protein
LVKKLVDEGFLDPNSIVPEIPIIDMTEATFDFVVP